MKSTIAIMLAVLAFAKGYAQADTTIDLPSNREVPEFYGGDSALVKFLQQNVNYPQAEIKNNIQGRVVVRVVIMEDGSVTNVEVISGVSAGLDAEAVRVAKMLPKFKPGKLNGEAVKVYYNIPIVFSLGKPDTFDSRKKKQ